jgi:hypothetical protein
MVRRRRSDHADALVRSGRRNAGRVVGTLPREMTGVPALGDVVDSDTDSTPRLRPEQRVTVGFWTTAAVAATFWAIFIARTRFMVRGRTYFVLFDDAMISMRYARNLAHGHGLVWNVGGERVEGISNPLWTLWMAVLHLLPVGDALQPLLVMLSGVVVLLATLWVVRRLVEALTDDGRIVIIAVVMTAAYYPLIFWTLRGMEVGVLALLLTYAALCAIRFDPALAHRTRVPRWNRTALAGAGVAAIAVRLDAIAPVSIIVMYACWRTPKADRRAVAIVLGGSVVGAIAAMTAARRAYYGDWLPNTYYLKATGISLGRRLEAGAAALGKVTVVQLLGLGLLAAFGVARWRRRPEILLLVGIVAVQVAYSVWVGGDAWEVTSFSNRYLTVAVPALAVLAAFGVVTLVDGRNATYRLGMFCLLAAGAAILMAEKARRTSFIGAGIDDMHTWRPRFFVGAAFAAAIGAFVILRRPKLPRRVVLIAVTATVIVATNYQSVDFWLHGNAFGLGQEIPLAREGLFVREVTKDDAVVAVWLAGTGPYFSHRPSVDLYGKSDKHIARLEVPAGDEFRPGHNKFDLAYSIRTYRPDIVQQGPFLGWSRADQALLDQEGYINVRSGRFSLTVLRSSTRVDPRLLTGG